MSLDPQYDRYLSHQKGLALLWFWYDQWKDVADVDWVSNTVELSELLSSRFVLGAPKKSPRRVKKIKSKNIFLGVQKNEAEWVSRIQWKRCVWDEKSRRLWLISEKCESPDRDWPDLPSVSVGILIDPPEKLSALQAGMNLDWRRIWWDDDDVFHIDTSVAGSWYVRTGDLNTHWTAAEKTHTKTLKDLIKERLDQTNVVFDPGFSGSIPELPSDLAKLNQPFESAGPAQMIENKYPNLFGQFLDTDGKKK